MIREIILDTETTGLDPSTGHRIVEIACVETIGLVPTGSTFHVYLNPQRDMPIEAFNVHGLSEVFLSSKPLFSEISTEFLNFVGDAPLVIHNAEFDMRFLNAELKRAGCETFTSDRAFDTLSFARRKFPNASNSLDALCNRFKINNSARTKHGALLDAELLAEVYIELMGGRQTNLLLAAAAAPAKPAFTRQSITRVLRASRELREADRLIHVEFLKSFNSATLWTDYLSLPQA